jgi:hypothetical protein
MPVFVHPCSTIHTAIPLILSKSDDSWPKVGEPVYVTVPQRAFFYGRPVCQIGKPTDQLLGICTERITHMDDIVSVNTVIRFFSVMLRGLCYKDNKIIITSPDMKQPVQWKPEN